jgi:hypothetical protein
MLQLVDVAYFTDACIFKNSYCWCESLLQFPNQLTEVHKI